jgi:hypothetical protein
MKQSLAEGHLPFISCSAWYQPIPRFAGEAMNVSAIMSYLKNLGTIQVKRNSVSLTLGAPQPTKTTSHCPSPAAAGIVRNIRCKRNNIGSNENGGNGWFNVAHVLK